MLFSCHIVHIRYSVGHRQTLANTKWINATSNNLKHETMNGAWKWSCIILGWYLTKIRSTSRILGDDEMWLGLYFNFGKSLKIHITLMSGILGDDGMELTLGDASGVYLRQWRSRFAGGILPLTQDHRYHHHKRAFPSSIMRWCMRYATFSFVFNGKCVN